MKTPTVLAISFSILGLASSLHAAGTSTYQVTGPVLEVTDAKIVVQKATEKWEIARSADTKVTGDLKVGSTVTIQYTMSATTITAKPDKAAAPAKTAPAKPADAPAKPAKKAA